MHFNRLVVFERIERSDMKVSVDFFMYSQPCVKRPYKTRHIFGFSDRLQVQVANCCMKVVLMCELSALLSFSTKQPPVNSDFLVT